MFPITYLLSVLYLAIGVFAAGNGSRDLQCRQVPAGFAYREGSKIYVDGAPYYFAGAGQYWLTSYSTTKDIWNKTFDRFQELEVRVVRVFVYGIDHTAGLDPVRYHHWDGPNLTVNYGEDGLGRIDKMVEMCKEYNMKLILVLGDNWAVGPEASGAANTYVTNVIGAAGNYHSDFFSDPTVIKVYESFVKAVVERYKDSPEFFAWELLNEQQGDITAIEDRRTRPGFDVAAMTKWIADRSAFIKQLDPHHLVSIGDSGFFNIPGHPRAQYRGVGQMDFDANLALDTVDFGTFHLYEWGYPDVKEWGLEYINSHIDSMKKIGKPVICEEFGAVGGDNQAEIYPVWVKAMLDGGLNGIVPWMVSGVGIYKQATEKTEKEFDIYPEKTVVWKTLVDMAQTLNART